MLFEIVPHLYISDLTASQDYYLLKRHRITAVVQCLGGVKPAFPDEIQYKVIDVADLPTENISQYFKSTSDFIHRFVSRGQNVLVHW